MKWRGRLGWVLLGPTEHRVATYLEAMTRHGRVTLRSTSIASSIGLSRTELYRITARLRMLGVFGIENDQGGQHAGRRIWRTAAVDSSSRPLDHARHRLAWGRIAAWSRARAARLLAAARGIVNARPAVRSRVPDALVEHRTEARRSGPTPGAGPPSTFRDALRQHAPALAAAWRL